MFKYSYTAFNGVKSACNIYIMHAGIFKYIGFEDIDEGVSVTNSSEQLATSIMRQNEWDPKNCLFFEWYLFHIADDMTSITVDEIEYDWDSDLTARNPRWKSYWKLANNPFKIK